MQERAIFDTILFVWIAGAPIVCAALFFVSAPYGRHSRPGWGPKLPRSLGWIVMEAPALLVFVACFVAGDRHGAVTTIVLSAMWVLYYGHRSLVFPFRLRGPDRGMAVGVVAMGFAFNVVNGYLQGRHLNTLAPAYPPEWLADPRFVLGFILFASGLAINVQSDHLLIALRGADASSRAASASPRRAAGSDAYQLPRGGLFRWVSCPNYLGEIIEWTGWALATWSLAGVAFAAWTLANLLPRAVSHHRWYRERFSDYPRERRALFPFLL